VRKGIIFSLACFICFSSQIGYAERPIDIIKDYRQLIEKEESLLKAMTEQNFSVANRLIKELDKGGQILVKEIGTTAIKEMIGSTAGALLTIAEGITIAAKGFAAIYERNFNEIKVGFIQPYIEARERGDSDEAAWNVAKWGLQAYFEGVKPKYNEQKIHEYARKAYELKLKIKEHKEQLQLVEDSIRAKGEIISKSQFSQQSIVNTSTRQGIKDEFPKAKILSQQQLQKIPHGQISPEVEKRLIKGVIYSDSAKQKLASSHQLVTPVKVSFTQTFKGFFTQIPDYPSASTADIFVNITEGTRRGAGSRPGDFTGTYTARAIAEPGWIWVEHHNTPFEGATATGTVEAKGFKEGPLKGSMTVNWESSVEKVVLTSNEVTIETDGSLTANNLNGSVIDKSSGATEGTWKEGRLVQTPK